MPANSEGLTVLRQGENFYSEHTILVAFCVNGDSIKDAENKLMALLPDPNIGRDLEAWWIAEDERHDRSDHFSAVFVNKGQQWLAAKILHAFGLTDACNIPSAPAEYDEDASILIDYAEGLENYLEHRDFNG